MRVSKHLMYFRLILVEGAVVVLQWGRFLLLVLLSA
jgi:hypothetical protein